MHSVGALGINKYLFTPKHSGLPTLAELDPLWLN